MNRVKIINDPSELVPMLLAVDSPLKRDIMRDLTESWKSMKDIEEKYGPEGKDTLIMFEKAKIVESKWQPAGFKPEKVYHTYYNSIHINIQTPITEMSDVLSVAVMPDKDFKKLEKKALSSLESGSRYVGDMADDLAVSPVLLKSLVRRSTKLEYRGHRIEVLKDE